MDFLRNKSKAIRQDAFHIFKVFAANPRKPPKVPWSEWIAIQSTQIGKAIISVFWSPLKHSIAWWQKKFVVFTTIDVWIKRRLMVG